MSETFSPHLVNGPFDDPVLYVSFRYQRRALLFDLGNIERLGLRDLHKVTDVFVSHTHMDHFVGFDHLLRTSLNREEGIRLYGPSGITDNVRGKLAGYTWNLTESYPLRLTVYEVGEERQRLTRFCAARQFAPEAAGSVTFEGVLVEEPAFSIRAAILDHRIPCLAFALEEKNRLNIRRDRMESMGIDRGPWLEELKRMVREKAPESAYLEMPARNGSGKLALSLKEWRQTLLVEKEGQKVVYIVDNIFSPSNVERIVALARGADLFYCEAAFAQSDEEKAKERYHLTTAQAGELARLARVKRFVPFHFSQRYEKEPERLREEAMAAFAGRSG